MTRLASALIALVALVVLAACRQQMADQPKYEALEAAPGFAEDRAAHHPPAGTVSREAAAAKADGPVYREAAMRRGRERYAIYCVPCHGILGDGRGPVVQRGFPAPPSFHLARLRRLPDRYFYRTITEGRGDMAAYADRLSPADRWAVVVYIRALQQSQHTLLAAHPQYRDAVERAGDNGQSEQEQR